VHSTEKSLEEHSDKVSSATVEVIEMAIVQLKDAMEGEDAGKIKAKTQDLTEAAMKLGEAIYRAQAEDSEEPDDTPEAADEAMRENDDDVVDADFEEVDDNKKAS